MTRKPKDRSRRISAEQVFAAFAKDGFDACGDGFGIVRDVSTSGLSMRSPTAVAPHSRVTANVSVGESCFQLQLIVRRVEDLGDGQYLLGMQFTGDLEARKPFLRTYLASQQAKQPPSPA